MAPAADVPSFDDEGHVRVVVESPRGSHVKLKYDPGLGVFQASRMLPLGIVYPYDWGYVAGTCAPDGDPLDAMVLAEMTTWPGVVIPSIPIGLVRVVQRERPRSRPVRNDRVLVVPASDPRHLDVAELSMAWRRELAAFYVTVGGMTHAEVRVTAWAGARAARRTVEEARRRARAS